MNTTKKDEALRVERALKLALEALKFNCVSSEDGEDLTPAKIKKAITAIRAALASKSEVLAEQPAQQQEPVAWRELCRRLYIELYWCDRQMMETLDQDGEPMWTQGKEVRDVLADAKAALDTSPPASKPWVGLTEEDANQLVEDCDWYNGPIAFCFDVAAKLREKNA